MHIFPVISVILSLIAIIIESYAFMLGPGYTGILGIDSMSFMRLGVYTANASVVLAFVVYIISKIKKITVKNSFAALILSIIVLVAPLLSVFLVMLRG